jgi:hypothetical protein
MSAGKTPGSSETGQLYLEYGKDVVTMRQEIGCPVYVPYMSRICLVPYKIRDIYGATARHIQKIICFSNVRYYIGGIQNIFNPKTIFMAKLSGPLQFEGKLDEFSAYKMKGCKGTVLRKSWGPSRKDIKNKDSYELTRNNITEFGGCSTTGAYLKRVLKPLEGVVDFRLNSTLTGLMKPVQKADLESTWGKRNVLISRKPFLLEGLNLNRRSPFDAVVSSPIQTKVDKLAGTALVSVPELLPSVNFFPPANFSVCRITAVMGIAPDFYYAEPRYKPLPPFKQLQNVTASSEWFLASKGCRSCELDLSLPGTLPEEGFSLLIAVGIGVGTPLMGEMVPLRYNGCGKIVVVK